MRLTVPILVASLTLGAATAWADDGMGCVKYKWSVAREQAAFAAQSLPTLSTGQALPAPGTAATVALQPQAGVAFPHAPGRKPKAEPAYAAVLTLTPLDVAGPYTVTLSEEAWIDVLQDGKEIRSSAFSGQPDCPGVRKSVKFALQPGPATIQISGASVQAIKVDVLPAD